MKYTNKYNLPEGIVNAVKNNREEYSKGKANISVSGVVMPPRMYQLFARHADEIVIDVADEIDALFGSAVHYILQQSDTKKGVHSQQQALLLGIQEALNMEVDDEPGAVALMQIKHIKNAIRQYQTLLEPTSVTTEQRWYMRVGEWRVSGQYDRLDLATGLLEDYKTTSVYKVRMEDFKDWEQRMNLYRLLGKNNGVDISKLQINAYMKDWRRSEKTKFANYPEHKLAVINLPIWNLMEAQQFIVERVLLHYNASQQKEEDLPLCTDEERWKRPDKWKAIKPGNKKATRASEDEEEINKFIVEQGIAGTKYDKIKETGYALRCMEFCSVAPFCSQFKAESAPETDFENVVAEDLDDVKLVEEDKNIIEPTDDDMKEIKEQAEQNKPKDKDDSFGAILDAIAKPVDKNLGIEDQVKAQPKPQDFKIEDIDLEKLLGGL